LNDATVRLDNDARRLDHGSVGLDHGSIRLDQRAVGEPFRQRTTAKASREENGERGVHGVSGGV
jgi:hypothetical protein